MPQPDLILASASPRRLELLSRLGVPFRVRGADLPEISGETAPEAVARDLALQKGRAVLELEPGALVLAADTVVALEGDLLGKPADAAQNRAFLKRLSGKTHRVITGVALLSEAGERAGTETTRVTFRDLARAEIEWYAGGGEGLDKAGGYGIQELGAALIARVEGDYSNVVGLPLPRVITLLRAAGVTLLGEREPA